MCLKQKKPTFLRKQAFAFLLFSDRRKYSYSCKVFWLPDFLLTSPSQISILMKLSGLNEAFVPVTAAVFCSGL